jgi:FixJ family two-component response regulator
METWQQLENPTAKGDPMDNTGALVYVVDDDPSAREGVARLIRSAGLLTKTFASGEEFLATPRPKRPSYLVLDVNLPGLNGFDLQQELGKSGSQVPIVFLTGHGDIPMAVRAVRAGATSFLTKPCDDEDLLNAIRQSIAYDVEEEIRPAENIGNIVGKSPCLRRVLKTIHVVAQPTPPCSSKAKRVLAKNWSRMPSTT